MDIADIKLSELSDSELLEAQKSINKFLISLKTEYADAKKKEEERS